MDLGKDFESPRGSPERQWRVVDGQAVPGAEHVQSLAAVFIFFKHSPALHDSTVNIRK